MLVRLLALAALLCGCAATAETGDYPADGVFVSHTRVRLAPYQTGAFEELFAECVAAAEDAAIDHDWLLYREPPGRYWLLLFGDRADAFPAEGGPLLGFARDVAARTGDPELASLAERFAALDHDVEWSLVTRQKTEWCTVPDVSSVTHPKARLMLRTVRPGAEAAFERALAARTAFFAEHGYGLPIEGFVVVAGAPGTAMQVVFPVDWPSFHATDSFGAFVRSLDTEAQEDYAGRKAALMETMARAEFYDGSFAPELSFGSIATSE